MGELATERAACPMPEQATPRSPAAATGPGPTALPAPGVMDHTAYPQIMDAVFAWASGAALLSLRATCKLYRGRVDALLARHVALTDTDLRSALGPRLPLQLPSPPAVLDCFAHYALHPAPHVRDASGAPVLRMRDGPLAVIDAIAPSTVIVFGWHRRNEPPETKWVVLGGSPRRASPVEHCATVRKVVIVIDGVPDYTCYAKGMVSAWPSIRDITVVYVPKGPQFPPERIRALIGDPVTLDVKIGNILYEMVARVRGSGNAGLRLTLVNADAFPEGAFPADGRVSWWATDLLRGKEVAEMADPACPHEPVECATLREYVDAVRSKFALAATAIRFLSLDEYELELGHEAFALETDSTFALR